MSGPIGDNVYRVSGVIAAAAAAGGAIDWQTGDIKTATFTATVGEGYFCNTSGGAFEMDLPAGTAGDLIAVADYTRTFGTNNLTVDPNLSEKIGGVADSAPLNVNGQAATFVYVDSTEGWINIQETQTSVFGVTPAYVTATGGTPCSGAIVCTDYKVHTFTGDGNFCVSNAGNSAGSNTVDYLVVAGGGGGGLNRSGGGGGGGYRESDGTASGCYSVSPRGAQPCTSALPVTASCYPISVGAAGAGSAGPPHRPGYNGGNSIFSTITSAGGGGGGDGNMDGSPVTGGLAGGSGGGGGACSGAIQPRCGGAGNTPSTTPAQGFAGGDTGPSIPVFCAGAGGGGGTVVGVNAGPARYIAGNGGTGATSSIDATPTQRAGGGGGGSDGGTAGTASGGGGAGSNDPTANGTAGTTNTGGGGGGSGTGPHVVAGGSGVVVLRYKFQN